MVFTVFRAFAIRLSPGIGLATQSAARLFSSAQQSHLVGNVVRKSSRLAKKFVGDEKQRRVVAFATAESYRLEQLGAELKRAKVYSLQNIEDGEDEDSDTLHLSPSVKLAENPTTSSDIFVSRNGTVVFWNVAQDERNLLMSLLKPHQDQPYRDDVVESEMEEVGYADVADGKKHSHLAKDTIWLRNPDGEANEKSLLLEKYTISNVMSISVKLAVWESLLSELVDSIEDIVEQMKKGRILLSRVETLKKSGELTAFRYNINLGLSGLLDVPDFYWDRESLEPLYSRTKHYFSISQRTQVMNEKLNYCFELMDLVHARLAEKHSARLEWMIIVLICIEVAMEVIHYWHVSSVQQRPEVAEVHQ